MPRKNTKNEGQMQGRKQQTLGGCLMCGYIPQLEREETGTFHSQSERGRGGGGCSAVGVAVPKEKLGTATSRFVGLERDSLLFEKEVQGHS
jgi:hypothetical protein